MNEFEARIHKIADVQSESAMNALIGPGAGLILHALKYYQDPTDQKNIWPNIEKQFERNGDVDKLKEAQEIRATLKTILKPYLVYDETPEETQRIELWLKEQMMNKGLSHEPKGPVLDQIDMVF